MFKKVCEMFKGNSFRASAFAFKVVYNLHLDINFKTYWFGDEENLGYPKSSRALYPWTKFVRLLVWILLNTLFVEKSERNGSGSQIWTPPAVVFRLLDRFRTQDCFANSGTFVKTFACSWPFLTLSLWWIVKNTAKTKYKCLRCC